MQRMILGIFLFTLTGTAAELLLLDHIEGIWQLIPLILMGFSLLVLAWLQLSKSFMSIRVFQGTMMLFIASGIIGSWQHFSGNREFELEMYESMKGWELFWESMKGAFPVLAPGTMIALGLIGWVYTRYQLQNHSDAFEQTSLKS